MQRLSRLESAPFLRVVEPIEDLANGERAEPPDRTL